MSAACLSRRARAPLAARWRLARVVLVVPLIVASGPDLARADGAPATPAIANPTPTASTAAAAPTSAAAPTAPAPVVPNGLGVLATPGAEAAARALARAIYATPTLRPRALDEAHARVLIGDAAVPAGQGAPADARDLSDTRLAVHGDDAPSRALLASIANTFHLRGIVVVEMRNDPAERPHPFARVFLADGGAFDAARYEPDDRRGAVTPWQGATRSLERAYAAPQPASMLNAGASGAVAPALAVGALPAAPRKNEAPASSHSFYTSPWFWGAVGAAALGGAAVYFATRDNGGDTIHLQLQVPK